jgi:hypothetical protein
MRDLPLSKRPKVRSWTANRPESGECRLKRGRDRRWIVASWPQRGSRFAAMPATNPLLQAFTTLIETVDPERADRVLRHSIKLLIDNPGLHVEQALQRLLCAFHL